MTLKYFLAPLALAFGLTMTAAHAGDLNLTCEMKRTKGEWVMPRFDLIEAKDGTIRILDGAIYEHNDKQPVPVVVQKNGDKVFDFTWRIDLPSMQGNLIKLKSIGKLDKTTGNVTVTAFLLARNQRSFARGHCTPR